MPAVLAAAASMPRRVLSGTGGRYEPTNVSIGPKSHGGSATLLPGAEGAMFQNVLLAPAVVRKGRRGNDRQVSGCEGEALADAVHGAGRHEQQRRRACVRAPVVVAAAVEGAGAAAQPQVAEQVVVRPWTGAGGSSVQNFQVASAGGGAALWGSPVRARAHDRSRAQPDPTGSVQIHIHVHAAPAGEHLQKDVCRKGGGRPGITRLRLG